MKQIKQMCILVVCVLIAIFSLSLIVLEVMLGVSEGFDLVMSVILVSHVMLWEFSFLEAWSIVERMRGSEDVS